MALEIFERLESEVRGYIRSFPTVFARAAGAELFDGAGRRYIDFFAGAGALNYGHNPPALKQALLDYLSGDGVVHALDMATEAKQAFLQTFEERILRPRTLDYKVQFTGPTGTNAVEAALKLARKVTGRKQVVFFTNAFHGMTLGSLAVTGNARKRAGAAVPLEHTTAYPYDGYGPCSGCGFSGAGGLELLEKLLVDTSSGLDLPAAVILETVQAEGGVNVAGEAWLRRLAELCKQREVLLIVDDIQVGVGRTGPFFSFEPFGLVPDMVCLSKSISGYGMPMAILLLRPELDHWAPGEHNGTFRGFNPGFVTATAALDAFWSNHNLSSQVEENGRAMRKALEDIAGTLGIAPRVRGRGMIAGLECTPLLATLASKHAFKAGLVVETAGPNDEVLKLLPPLTIEPQLLQEGLGVLSEAFAKAAEETTQ